MMRYDEFKETVVDKIRDYLPVKYKNYSIEVHKISKINEELDALCVINTDLKIGVSPIVYINHMYEEYEKSKSLPDVLKKAADTISNTHIDINPTLDCENLKENTIFVLVNAEDNKAMLSAVPHKRFLDLAIVFRWLIQRDNEKFMGTIITNEMADKYNLNTDELFNIAKANTRRIYKPRFENVVDLVNRLSPNDPIPNDKSVPMYILSNEIAMEGASYILYEDILKDIRTQLGEDFYIIPSSINEVIIVPCSTIDAEYTKTMLRNVNRNVVARQEMLSDNVYRFDGKLSIV